APEASFGAILLCPSRFEDKLTSLTFIAQRSVDRTERLLALFKDYNAVGLTAIGDRDASSSAINRYRRLHKQDKLTVRIAASHSMDTMGATEKIQENIRRVAKDPLVKGDDRLRIVGIKTYLDGG